MNTQNNVLLSYKTLGEFPKKSMCLIEKLAVSHHHRRPTIDGPWVKPRPFNVVSWFSPIGPQPTVLQPLSKAPIHQSSASRLAVIGSSFGSVELHVGVLLQGPLWILHGVVPGSFKPKYVHIRVYYLPHEFTTNNIALLGYYIIAKNLW